MSDELIGPVYWSELRLVLNLIDDRIEEKNAITWARKLIIAFRVSNLTITELVILRENLARHSLLSIFLKYSALIVKPP